MWENLSKGEIQEGAMAGPESGGAAALGCGADMSGRTDEQIYERMMACRKTEILGFESAEYASRLPWSFVQEIAQEGMTEDVWESQCRHTAPVMDVMTDYIPFAWEKANNCRGVSVMRAISHYIAWLWLEGSPEAEALAVKIEHYSAYGKPQLVLICEFLGLDSSQWDDGIRGESEDECDAQRRLKHD